MPTEIVPGECDTPPHSPVGTGLYRHNRFDKPSLILVCCFIQQGNLYICASKSLPLLDKEFIYKHGDVCKFLALIEKLDSYLPSMRKNSRVNYRPISVLTVVSRLFEKLVYNQLYEYLNTNSLLSSSQSGLRAMHCS